MVRKAERRINRRSALDAHSRGASRLVLPYLCCAPATAHLLRTLCLSARALRRHTSSATLFCHSRAVATTLLLSRRALRHASASLFALTHTLLLLSFADAAAARRQPSTRKTAVKWYRGRNVIS